MCQLRLAPVGVVVNNLGPRIGYFFYAVTHAYEWVPHQVFFSENNAGEVRVVKDGRTLL